MGLTPQVFSVRSHGDSMFTRLNATEVPGAPPHQRPLASDSWKIIRFWKAGKILCSSSGAAEAMVFRRFRARWGDLGSRFWGMFWETRENHHEIAKTKINGSYHIANDGIATSSSLHSLRALWGHQLNDSQRTNVPNSWLPNANLEIVSLACQKDDNVRVSDALMRPV